MPTIQEQQPSQEGVCCICLTSLDSPGLGCQRLGCGHVLHEKCITEFRRYGLSDSCPLCRAQLPDLEPVSRMFDEAMLLHLRHSHEEAFQKLSQVLEVEPEHLGAIRLLAGAFQKGLGVKVDLTKAAQFYKSAVDMGADCHNNLGLVYKLLGNRSAAEHAFLHSKSPSSAFNLALMKKEAGDWKGAEALYWKAHRLGRASATLNLANMYAGLSAWGTGQDEKIAEQLYLELLGREMFTDGTYEFVETMCDAKSSLGLIYRRQGRHVEARQLFLDAHLTSRRLGENQIDGSAFDSGLQNLLVEVGNTLKKQGLQDDPELVLSLVHNIFSGDPSSVLRRLDDIETMVPKISKNSIVQIQGLESAAGRRLNGCRGTVLGKEAKTGRILVEVKEAGKKLIKRANLTLIRPMIPDLRSNASAKTTLMLDSTAYDLEAGLSASLHHAAETAAQNDAPLMDALMRSSPSSGLTKIVILEFSRNDEWFRHALSTATELESCRHELPSGAKCFVAPELFDSVVQSLQEQGHALEKRHIIVSPDMEQIVLDVLEAGRQSTTRKERGSFKMKGRSMLDVHVGPQASSSSSSSQPVAELSAQFSTWATLVKRTFIEIPLPSSMRSLSSVHPATA